MEVCEARDAHVSSQSESWSGGVHHEFIRSLYWSPSLLKMVIRANHDQPFPHTHTHTHTHTLPDRHWHRRPVLVRLHNTSRGGTSGEHTNRVTSLTNERTSPSSRPGPGPVRGSDFCVSKSIKTGYWSTQLPGQWVSVALSPGGWGGEAATVQERN